MKPIEVAGVNLWAVLLAAASAFVLRLIWYFPRFGASRNQKTSPAGSSQLHSPVRWIFERALLFAASLVTAFALARIIRLATVDTAVHGMRLASGIWIAFVLAVQLSNYFASPRKTAKPFFIEAGYQLTCFLVMAAIIAPWPQPQIIGTEAGFGLFKERCMSCHGNPNLQPPAPDPSALRRLSPEAIYAALTTGTMKFQGQGLTDEAKRRIAEALGGRPLGASTLGSAKAMPNQCSDNPPFSNLDKYPAWNGWGVDSSNTRFQTTEAAGLNAAAIPRLKLKWAFGFPGGVSAFGQPTIAGGQVFVGSDIGYVYSLDAASGCVHWSFQANAAVRNAISIGAFEKDGATRSAIYFGDVKANVYALDASDGTLLWTTRVEDHFLARITGSPTLHQHVLFVPVSSSEEWSAGSLTYPCCTFRGSVVALNANTGERLWKTYTIPQEPVPTEVNSAGTQLWAPAGAAVWNSPTVDAQRHAIYFGTGNSYTAPSSSHSDSIMALDRDTGKILWDFQATPDDSYVGGCVGTGRTRSENCSAEDKPDYDFGASPILRVLPDGRRILIAAPKSGTVFALDPDRAGALLWKTNLADKPPPTTGLIVFGGAADENNIYFGLTTGAMAAVRLTDGKRLWFTSIRTATDEPPVYAGMSAAVSAIPGVVFVGGWDGVLHALSTEGGTPLWSFQTARAFSAVNGVAAHGGSMGGPGPTIANGMLFVGSGYSVFGGKSMPGNVLLAFSIE
jgi:polyvinyl alcohol dehydrogenase (cytochrome)